VISGDLGPARLAEAVWTYWQVAIHPYWSRICGVLEDDVSYRAARSLAGGLFALLADIHPEVTLEGDRLFVDKPHHADAAYDGAQLTVIPSVFAWPNLLLSHSRDASFELTYAARGVGRVWEGITAEEEQPDALAALVGRTRALILQRLAIPASTTQLARDLGQSPSAVSQHLSVLRSSGLLTNSRSGRSVLYRQTPLATSILAACAVRESRRSGS
jgi:DNA-binding transcriptional ArsR family regulator